jgi:hypothetical protein
MNPPSWMSVASKLQLFANEARKQGESVEIMRSSERAMQWRRPCHDERKEVGPLPFGVHGRKWNDCA